MPVDAEFSSGVFADAGERIRESETDSFTEWAYEVTGMPADRAARLAEALVQLSEEGL